MERSQPTFPARHELKFFINRGDLNALAARLERVLWRDAHAGPDGEYFIRSVYFDDRANSAYYEKLEGGPARDKYRIRIYGLNEKQIYLERKRKLGELIAKDSVHITRRLAEQISPATRTAGAFQGAAFARSVSRNAHEPAAARGARGLLPRGVHLPGFPHARDL